MLPAWASVAIALGSSFITGLVAWFVAWVGANATAKVALIHIDQSRRDAWESRRLEACENLSRAAAKVPTCLNAGDVDGAREARDETVACLAHLSFLFGPDSPVTEAAEVLSKATGELIRNPEDMEWAARFPEDPFDGFYKAVHDAMEPPAGRLA